MLFTLENLKHGDYVDFLPVKGTPLTDEQAQRYGMRLRELEREHGLLTPELVLRDAEHANSPLHDAFEWNDTKAARKYRLEQARTLLRSIRVVVREDTSQRTSARAFLSLAVRRDNGSVGRGYVGLQRVLEDDELAEQVLQRLRGELVQMRERYDRYFHLREELRMLRQVMDVAIKELN